MANDEVLLILKMKRDVCNGNYYDSVDFIGPMRADVKLLHTVLYRVMGRHIPVEILTEIKRIILECEGLHIRDIRKQVSRLNPEVWPYLARVLRTMCALANTAEKAQKNRRRMAYDRSLQSYKVDFKGRDYTFSGNLAYFRENGIEIKEVYESIRNMHIGFVLTAHPTEANRLTSLINHRKICSLLNELDSTHLTPFKESMLISDLEKQVSIIWLLDQIRRQKPTPFDEVISIAHTVTDSIFESVPEFYQFVDHFFVENGLPPLPIDTKIFGFTSWAGGDRDGNPHVTPEMTKRTAYYNRMRACELYLEMIWKLAAELPMRAATEEFIEYTKGLESINLSSLSGNNYKDEDIFGVSDKEFACHLPDFQPNEVYRIFLRHVGSRLKATIYLSQRQLLNEGVERKIRHYAYSSTSEIIGPMKKCYASLCENNCEIIANSTLKCLIRCLDAFGLYLLKLDIRQEAEKHTALMNFICAHLNLSTKAYSEMSEPEKVSFIKSLLDSNEKFALEKIPPTDIPEDILSVMETFEVIGELGSEVIHGYVISMCNHASDILLVNLFLQKISFKSSGDVSLYRIKVIPLLETIESLRNSSKMLESLFSQKWYREYLSLYRENTEEVMIGYSDSGKDGGRIPALWEIHKAQKELFDVANRFEINMHYFHGRGGSISRGGGPLHLAILSQPQGTLNDYLRLTVQGETIDYMFALSSDCLRTLEYYLMSCVRFNFMSKSLKINPSWIKLWDEVTKRAYSSYRKTVAETDDFVEYFNALTPIKEMNLMNIGSRPQKRPKTTGLSGLRAIPWVFAWTQVQLNTPIWLGIGDGLQYAIESGKLEELKDMYENWPFCTSFLHLVSMVLLKTDITISEEYEAALVPTRLQHIGKSLREELKRTISLMKIITGEECFCESDAVVRRGFHCNRKWLGLCAALQIESLLRYRSCPESPYVHDTLVISMKAIAAVMQYTG